MMDQPLNPKFNKGSVLKRVATTPSKISKSVGTVYELDLLWNVTINYWS